MDEQNDTMDVDIEESEESEYTPDASDPIEEEDAEYSDEISAIDDYHQVITDASERRERIRKQATQAVKDALEVEGNNYKVRVADISLQEKNYTLKEQKEAILARQSLTESLQATLEIVDKNTGEVVDRSKRTVARVPYFTDRHTFTVEGNEYSVSNQLRLKAGVYTRRRDNDELEASFNLGRGKNFRIYLEPSRGIFYVQYDSTSVPLYSVVNALGYTDEQLEKAWGKELLQKNTRTNAQRTADVRKLYKKIVPEYKQTKNADLDTMLNAVRESYSKTVLRPEVTETTLGKAFSQVDSEALLSASKKLLRVYNEEDEEDDRDSLEFKSLHTVDTFFKERINKNAAPDYRRKVIAKLNRTSSPKIKEIIPPTPFSKPFRSLITTSALSSNPTQINPLEIVDAAAKVTSLGEGGIGSLRAVPDSAREQHGSQIGVIDPVRTPESGAVGVDVRVAMYTAVDKRGDMFTPLVNMKTKQVEYVPVGKFARKNVAFPSTDFTKENIPVIRNNKVYNVKKEEVDYAVPNDAALYGPTSNLVPGINNMQGNRAIMGAKQLTQSVPLLKREAPLVQVYGTPEDTMEGTFGKWHLPKSPVDGTVVKVDDDADQIVIKDKQGKEHRVDFAKDFPFMSKTRLNHEVFVKPGDKVKKNQHLAESNFTKNGQWAGGVNLSVAYAAWQGLNSNDAIVISEKAANEKLVSEHMYREVLPLNNSVEVDKQKHRVYFGSKHTAKEYDNLDDRGVIKQGVKVQPGELVVAAVAKKRPTQQDALLGKLGRNTARPYRDISLTWEHNHEGEVKDVQVTSNSITVTIYTLEPMGIGDKLSGRHGNKGVVAKIIPQDQMPRDENGDPVDVIVTSAGVVSRINPSQVIETALGKVAKKTGKPIVLKQFEKGNRVDMAKKILEENGVKDKETLYDPVTGKHIPGIMVGQQYMLKLFKSTDTNFSARGIGATDTNNQPTKGGDEGAKSFGRMDYLALVAHGAHNILREGATVKSDKNDDYWRRLELGLPTGSPKPSYAFNKALAMMIGGGMNVQKHGSQFTIGALTDKDVDALAQNAIQNPGVIKVKSSKSGVSFAPEKGGLFDPALTGGIDGTRWSKIELTEPVVNPIFEKPARELLGMTSKEFSKTMYEDGAQAIKDRLNSLDLDAEEKRQRREVAKYIDSRSPTAASNVDKAARKIKYIQALRKQNVTAGDAYVISKVPVIPPKMRSVVTTDSGSMLISDPNYLYKDLLVVNNAIRDMPEELREIDDPIKRRKQLHSAVKAVMGLGDPVNPKTKARGVTGFMPQLVGYTSPKQGFLHEKLMKRRQQLSGRGTIAPDPSLDLDEIGIPEEMLWKTFQPFTMQRLVKRGYGAVQAKQMIEERHPAARRELMNEVRERPVIVNRAPTLHRFNMIGAYAKPVPGKTILLNPFAEIGMNADYDGDAIQVHTPASEGAVQEAKNMTLSNLIFSDGQKNSIMVRPQHEAIYGAFMATTPDDSPVRKFKTLAEAKQAYARGEIKMSTRVEITG